MTGKNVFLGSLLGAALIQVALACSSASPSSALSHLASMVDGSSAHADGSSSSAPVSTCSQWEVRSFAPAGYTDTEISEDDGSGKSQQFPVITFGAFTLPSGWEPITGGEVGMGVTARHCLAN